MIDHILTRQPVSKEDALHLEQVLLNLPGHAGIGAHQKAGEA